MFHLLTCLCAAVPPAAALVAGLRLPVPEGAHHPVTGVRRSLHTLRDAVAARTGHPVPGGYPRFY